MTPKLSGSGLTQASNRPLAGPVQQSTNSERAAVAVVPERAVRADHSDLLYGLGGIGRPDGEIAGIPLHSRTLFQPCQAVFDKNASFSHSVPGRYARSHQLSPNRRIRQFRLDAFRVAQVAGGALQTQQRRRYKMFSSDILPSNRRPTDDRVCSTRPAA